MKHKKIKPPKYNIYMFAVVIQFVTPMWGYMLEHKNQKEH